MLLGLTICQLVIACVASPHRKYPFTFLLDVGNEELEKTNTEQIRVSIPGGSLAIRYPAVADGDLITHVRVSSIDFGSDLKASILDGGPGYKYVVLVFLGNAGVACDAVVTLQTLPNAQDSSNNDPNSIANWSTGNSVSQTSDESETNTSAEDMSDDSETKRNSKSNAELALPSSNVDNYAQISKDEDENENDSEETRGSHVKFNEKEESFEEEKIQEQDSVLIEEDDEESSEKTEEQDSASNEVNDDDIDDDNNHAERLQTDEGYQSKYNNNLLEASKEDEALDEDARMYRQDSLYDAQGHDPSGDDPVELDQMFNDEEIHNDSDKFKDNNNNFDSEYQSAVA